MTKLNNPLNDEEVARLRKQYEDGGITLEDALAEADDILIEHEAGVDKAIEAASEYLTDEPRAKQFANFYGDAMQSLADSDLDLDNIMFNLILTSFLLAESRREIDNLKQQVVDAATGNMFVSDTGQHRGHGR